jgi:hypothetical protein
MDIISWDFTKRTAVAWLMDIISRDVFTNLFLELDILVVD